MLIKDISKEERPRERLLKYGVNSLSNEELLSIILSLQTNLSFSESTIVILPIFFIFLVLILYLS